MAPSTRCASLAPQPHQLIEVSWAVRRLRCSQWCSTILPVVLRDSRTRNASATSVIG